MMWHATFFAEVNFAMLFTYLSCCCAPLKERLIIRVGSRLSPLPEEDILKKALLNVFN